MNTSSKATLGGGCFWCVEATFKRIEGVQEVYSGYSGGASEANANYKDVCKGDTGHAEVVQITFDESKLTYSDLLKVFFVVHNPTTLNRQGEDVGHQYRSIIFYHTEQQKEIAIDLINEVQKGYKDKVVTEVVPYEQFYRAEQYHLDYYDNNTQQGYCSTVITPKIEKIVKTFHDRIKNGFK